MKVIHSITLILLFAVDSIGQNTSYQLLESRLDSLIGMGIDSAAFPGAQILVRYKNKVVFHKTWGHHTYDQLREVRKKDIYDMASVTKVSSGLPILMKMYGMGLLDLDAPIGNYYKSLKSSNKKNLTLRNVLAHQAKLAPYIVFWQEAKKKNGKYKCRSFKNKKSKRFPIRITDSLYMHRKYYNKMKKAIRKTPLLPTKEYAYSGLSFILMPEMISQILHQPFESYLYNHIYKPIGITTLRYNPLSEYSVEDIVPTEYDSLWRHQLIHGTVHDEAAAMLSGISCNAGLFGDAESLSILFQLYLNEGSWDGKEIIPAHAIREFTSYQFDDNRRGLGFDKPLREYNEEKSYVAKSASTSSFGHSGFTGTMVWADPEHDLVFVFLSNRVYPNRDHRQLYQLGLRPLLHQAVYDHVVNKEK